MLHTPDFGYVACTFGRLVLNTSIYLYIYICVKKGHGVSCIATIWKLKFKTENERIVRYGIIITGYILYGMHIISPVFYISYTQVVVLCVCVCVCVNTSLYTALVVKNITHAHMYLHARV